MSRPPGPRPAPGRSPWPSPPHTLPVLVGVRTNLLTLQPALRTLTNDYNGLKRQVRGFPLLLQEALRSVKAEVRAGRGGRGGEQPRALGRRQRPPGLSSKVLTKRPRQQLPDTRTWPPQTSSENAQPGQVFGRLSNDDSLTHTCYIRPYIREG